MKKLLYSVLKPLIRAGFFCYYREVRMIGMERVPRDRPVVFLPNHHNALLDPLLIAAYIRGRRPYFLTRSDVFQGGLLEWFFDMLRMIPIYRLRDGRDTLHRNEEIFERCADLLAANGDLLLFPEANHNLKRQVRPLSKGFTRIVLHTLKKYPDTDLHLVPVGFNYHRAAGFPDRVACYFGEALPAASFLKAGDEQRVSREMKSAVSSRLKQLTTHIPPECDYEATLQELEADSPDWLLPGPINDRLSGHAVEIPTHSNREDGVHKIWDFLFRALNLPAWLLWRWIAANKVWEPEFMSTFRYLFALLAFPLYLGLLAATFALTGAPPQAYWCLPGLFLFNVLYVKFR
ncbi:MULTISPECIES: lysophospholipid acyltransferase family protein [unclassified Robiginitalea]|uniref:lysophospholipid acyltransferase family protein n=1 Tax=Robiginitalea TaxID=252306 RepID=UPI002349C412|nr:MULTISPECIES: lysophospholipid acyltransferase family protein [unclassified Robiginitalea]MDC6355276.1 lysophospholipid acyltransferase family protein [Robiginitalea sp. PM2]MDC6375509.1 lysophospholipid acyltransferase family protein [Robiginitalea sp. SP8]